MNWQDKCSQMFGVHWRSVLSNISGVHRRTIGRWCVGEFQIKQEVVDKINATYEIWRNSQGQELIKEIEGK